MKYFLIGQTLDPNPEKDLLLTWATVSGNLAPNVSGKNMASIPPSKLDPPMIIKGAVPCNPANSGAAIPPILATIDAVPTAELRIIVGYSSAVYKYTIAKLAEAPNFPRFEKKYIVISM